MSTEIDEVLSQLEPQAAQPQEDSQSQSDPKVGQLVNENAEYRRRVSDLEMQMQNLRDQMAQSSQPKPQETSDQWDQWAGNVVDAVPGDRWLTDTRGAVRQVLARGGRQLADFAEQRAERKANQVASAFRADMEYTSFYPDDMSSEIGVEAVRRSVTELIGDQRFQDALKVPAKRPQAWAAVHKMVQRKLGRDQSESDVMEDNGRTRKAPFAEMGGGFRPMQHGAPSVKAEGEDKAMQDMIDYTQARR